MIRRPLLTLRARLTLLYTGLFAVCGAIVVAVSYALVAQLGVLAQAQGAGGQPHSAGSVPASVAARCRSEHLQPRPNKDAIVQCIDAYLRNQGAQSQRDLTLSHLLQYSLVTLVVVIVVAGVLGWLVAGRALRPVHLVTAAARAASEQNLSARVAVTGPRDELRELAETFDAMLARLQAAFEGQQAFIANASHELRTPLAVMRATIEVVLDNPDSTPADLRAMGADIAAAVQHAEQLIGALLILARNQRGLTVHEDIDLATCAENVLDTARPAGRHLHATLAPALICGDPVLAERLIANLVDNALRYNHPAGHIWITTGTRDGHAELTVANTGPPISPADAARILQPFQRIATRTSHDGSGLGLALVASIAAIHHGTTTVTPRPAGGLTVTITIPATTTPRPQPSTPAPQQPAMPRSVAS